MISILLAVRWQNWLYYKDLLAYLSMYYKKQKNAWYLKTKVIRSITEGMTNNLFSQIET